ncbi:DUF4177 domain-containing protein [Defluviimonas sp. WL0075]|uniref:DUF4177 domain-containing protein n=1 Tax=Albidovulum sediminicola TaxID=2984331 RepID=A0ABT2YXV5_9RHOB|nr:DUF4177 domain-containing protein [Defluviimonas sp. WL0075]MCV2863650.1 DUF4177 domain-containing protein [Defluviimonas sp. WL0075]
MQRYEYKAVPLPEKGEKAPGARTADERYAHAIVQMMNRLGRDGWDYVRSDTFTREDKVGLARRSVTVHQTLMIFRRPLVETAATAPSEAARPSISATRAPEGSPAWEPLVLDRKEPKVTKGEG